MLAMLNRETHVYSSLIMVQLPLDEPGTTAIHANMIKTIIGY